MFRVLCHRRVLTSDPDPSRLDGVLTFSGHKEVHCGRILWTLLAVVAKAVWATQQAPATHVCITKFRVFDVLRSELTTHRRRKQCGGAWKNDL